MIQEIQIPYNKSYLKLQIPEENIANLIGHKEEILQDSNAEKLKNALHDHRGISVEQLAESKNIALIVEDHTREVPFKDRFNAVFPKLKPANQIKVFIATGTHDGDVEGNYKIKNLINSCAKACDIKIDKIIIHNCHHNNFSFVGTTSIGNDIYVNKEILETEAIMIFSDMKNHYFAGYSNALKSLLPGICKYESIERNHALTLNDKSTFGFHPLHPDTSRRDNPLAQDMYEGFKLIAGERAVYVLGTICKNHKITWAKFGELKEVVSEGILKVDSLYSVEVKPTDRMIVSSGGYPNDESLYISQRALELTKNAITPGGEILFFAGCANGIGPQKSIGNFYKPLKQDLEIILKNLSEKYVMYSHKTYKFAQLIQRMRAIHFFSNLKNSEVESIHLNPVKSPQQIVDSWLSENSKVKINIFTEGNKIAVHPI